MKHLELAGRWILVTGASSGLGREMARVLAARHHANLVLVARRQERLKELAGELSAQYGVRTRIIAADLCSISEVDRVFREITAPESGAPLELQGAILNAGITHFGNWDEQTWEDFERMRDLNITGVVRLCTQVLPHLEARGDGGGVMIVSSMLGLIPAAYQATYSATKAFLVNYGAALHHEMAPRGVSVTTFYPAGIVTEMTGGESFNELRGWMMPADRVARQAVDAFRERAYMKAPGALYNAAAAAMRLLPQRFFHSRLAAQYRSSLRGSE